MGPLLVFFLYILQLQASIRSEIIEEPNVDLNTISETSEGNSNENEVDERNGSITEDPLDYPYVKTGRKQTEVEFRYPIASLNVDYSKNLIVLKFRKSKADEEEERRRKSFNENFMRFGRASSDFMRFGRGAEDFMRFGRSANDFMRLGKRALEQVPQVNSLDQEYIYNKNAGANRRFERSQEGIRDARGDNFMRFGRAANDFMRFGRASGDFMRFGRNPSDFMRFGRGGSNDFMRFGRKPQTDFMRFGRTQKERRAANQDFMRFGRPDNFMRFGRSPLAQPTISPNFMRFGKSDTNFMRFGKSLEQQSNENSTKPPLPKEVIKEAAKLLHQAEQYGGEGESNPVDRAMKVLFSKDDESKAASRDEGSELNVDTTHNDDGEADYELNLVQ
ncbi:unnamed protein product [Ceratitis capitata]|uniref:(Mediterranean fruit fly) hypothetical protein n=1 Tax=Ceratitis capitata TaxID=7213 RepID=A0A811VG57_CERCA|nr:unnamed protein product [Ceratitis capitata]